MARLERGVSDKIDRINDLVAIVKDDNSLSYDKSIAMEELLTMFKPMMIKICDKWCKYFNDSSHKLVSFEELLSDAEYWFIHYTMNKYTIDGDATYNKFIKDHINQRIRYIYECHLRYYNSLIFPDPDKHQDNSDSTDPFELVAYNYSSAVSNTETMEDDVVDNITIKQREELAHRIMELVECGNFNERERRIFNEVMCNGTTQDEMSKKLGISRTRVVQIIKNIKHKLRLSMENDKVFWELITQTDVLFFDN